MVNYPISSDLRLDRVFSSLADPTRREILRRLVSEALTVTDIAQPYDMSLPAVSKHLKVLEKADLITRQKSGREYRIMAKTETLKEAVRYMEFYRQFWNEEFASLTSVFAK